MIPTRPVNPRLAADERARLEACAQEPIRTPGSVQAHGILIGVDLDLRTIIVVSENCAEVFGVGPDVLLGADVADHVAPFALAAVRKILDGAPLTANPIVVTMAGREWDLIAHSDGDLAFLEFEPDIPALTTPSPAVVFDAIHRLSTEDSVEGLRNRAAREIRAITGFDRVMIYHFHEDGHGEVVAEECADDMEPYIGLHFPASDIPPQARQLYITKLSRAIVSTVRETSPLLVSPDNDPGTIDLSCAELRSVSPYHVQFMRNMGQASTVSFSLVRGDSLIGMITCAHREERRLPYMLRSGLEVLANKVALRLSFMEEIAQLTDASRAREVRAQVADGLIASDDILSGLLDGPISVRDVVAADGVICSIGGDARAIGATPDIAVFEAAIAASSAGQRRVVVTDSLSADHPDLAAVMPDIAGVLFVPVATNDYLAFFREEVLRTVDWLGDLTPGNRPDALSPRTSFSAWTQSVSGTSAPWGCAVREAIELGRDVDHALLRRVESRLAQVALRDPLTGLPNRRALQERLGRLLEESPHVDVALMFLDLDHFKAINDSLGHDIGDELLVDVARRLERSAREHDTVARLGGDEFVIVCQDASEPQAEVVASRILDEIRRPFAVRGHRLTVTASIGVAVAASGADAADMLRRADASMYRAKESGRDRASH